MKKSISILTLLLTYCGSNTSLDDLQTLCQMTIDLPELQQYYHIKEAPERIPLPIIRNEFTKDLSNINKFGQPIEVITEEEAKQKNIKHYFVFTKVSIIKDTCIINFWYPIEGLTGNIKFKKEKGNWIINNKNIAEH